MPDIIYAVLGLLLIALCLYDFVMTTFLPSGQGPVTALVNHLTFQGLFLLAGKNGRSHLLEYAGLAIILVILFCWISLLWLGVLLIFVSDNYSVLNGATKLPADVFEKFYYTGFALSTLGVGDFVAGNDGWRGVTSLAAFVGLILITMSITFLVPVISNAGQKRTLGRQIESLGGTAEQIVINSYNGQDFKDLSSQLTSISSMIFTYAQNHLTYPVLHHMHNSKPEENIVLRLAALDEALTIFIFHIPEEKRPAFLDLYMVRRALSSYLDTIRYMETADTAVPPRPDLDKISRQTGEGLASTLENQAEPLYSQLEKRRKLWKANLERDGWQWDDMHEHSDRKDLDVSFANLKHDYYG
jgi:hypothetical protein